MILSNLGEIPCEEFGELLLGAAAEDGSGRFKARAECPGP